MDIEVIIDKLSNMTKNEIAEFLESENITGVSQALNCPVAEYVSRETGICTGVTSTYAQQFPTDGDSSSTYKYPGTSIEEFVRGFDRGEFPNLFANGGQ